jgi:hypothetical protein
MRLVGGLPRRITLVSGKPTRRSRSMRTPSLKRLFSRRRSQRRVLTSPSRGGGSGFGSGRPSAERARLPRGQRLRVIPRPFAALLHDGLRIRGCMSMWQSLQITIMLAGSKTGSEAMPEIEQGMIWWTCRAGVPQHSQKRPRASRTSRTTRR